MLKNTFLAAFIVISILHPAFAVADDSGGSGYSRFGIGDIRYFSTDRAMGMGGAGIAILSSNFIDRLNPAAWGRVNRTRFSIGTLYEGFSATDDISSAYLSKTHFNGFSLALPLSVEHGFVFSTGFTPYSSVNYNIVTPTTQGSLNYTLQYLGEGGLSLAHIGFSGKLSSDLFLGTKFNYYFGTIRHTISQKFTSTDYTTAESFSSAQLKGIGFTFGAVYTGLKSIFNIGETNALNIGVILSTTSYLTTQDERIHIYNLNTVTSRDTFSLPEGTTRLPFSFGAGLSYLSDRMILAGDLFYQHWDQFTVDGTHPAELRDSYRFGAGAEILPKRELTAPFTQRVTYRFGVYYNTSYYQIKGEPINEIGITGGLGIPVVGDAQLGISAEYGFRGTTAFGLQKDKILRISMTLSISELWFVRPEEE